MSTPRKEYLPIEMRNTLATKMDLVKLQASLDVNLSELQRDISSEVAELRSQLARDRARLNRRLVVMFCLLAGLLVLLNFESLRPLLRSIGFQE